MFDLSKINNDSYVAGFIYKTKEFDLTFFSEEDRQKIRIVHQKCAFANPALECQLITQPPIVQQVVEILVEPEVIAEPVVEEVLAIEPVIEVTPEVLEILPEIKPAVAVKKSKK